MSKLPGINGRVFDCDPRLKRLHEYVEQNYSEPIPLGKAARIAALGKSYFSSYFLLSRQGGNHFHGLATSSPNFEGGRTYENE